MDSREAEHAIIAEILQHSPEPESWRALIEGMREMRRMYSGDKTDPRYQFVDLIYLGAQVAEKMGRVWHQAAVNSEDQLEQNLRVAIPAGLLVAQFISGASRVTKENRERPVSPTRSKVMVNGKLNAMLGSDVKRAHGIVQKMKLDGIDIIPNPRVFMSILRSEMRALTGRSMARRVNDALTKAYRKIRAPANDD